MMKTELLIAEIKTEEGTQFREMNLGVIMEYAEALRNDAQFPPIEVYSDGSEFWLVDGFHRLNAHREAALSKIAAVVIEGTFEDAKWAACGANKSHGLRRLNKDKERAVREALLLPRTAAMTDRQIADHCGVSHVTVIKYRDQMTSVGQIDQQPRRQGRDGKTYQQKKKPKRSPVVTYTPDNPRPPAPALRAEYAPAKPALTIEETPTLTGDAARLLREFRYENGGLTGTLTDAGVRLWGDDLEKVSQVLCDRLARYLAPYDLAMRRDETVEDAA
jgi:hypothetical protein